MRVRNSIFRTLALAVAVAFCGAAFAAAPPVAMDTGQTIEASYVKATPVADAVTVAVAVPSITVAPVHRQRTVNAHQTPFTAQRPTFYAALHQGQAAVKWRSRPDTLS